MLGQHRINDADKALIAVEQPVPAGEQIAFQPALALVLAEHRVDHTPVRRKELIRAGLRRVPLTAGDFKHRAQHIRERLIGAKNPEIALRRVQSDDVAQELAEHAHVLRLHRAGRRHAHRVRAEVGHPQIAQ